EWEMTRFKKRFQTPGTPPGTLRAPEQARAERVTITVFEYGPDSLEEKALASIEEALPRADSSKVTWINVNGLHDVALLQKLGDRFGLHPLALEDVLNTGQRPKLEDYDEHYFIVMKELH